MTRRGGGGRLRWPGSVVVLAAALLVAGCGGDDPTPETAGAATAEEAAAAGAGADGGDAADAGDADGTAAPGCAVLTAEEVEAATGFTVTGAADFYGGCTWSIEGVDPQVSQAAISWQPFQGEAYDNQYDAVSEASGFEVEELDGTGDEAFWMGSGAGDNTLGEVWVRVGDQAFRITNEFASASYDGAREVQEALAAAVAAAL